MGWLEDLGNAVSSGVAVVADVVETVVETVTDTAENAVDGVADALQEGANYLVDLLNIHGGGVVGGIASVVGGTVTGSIEALQEIITGVLHIVKDAGKIVGSVLRLDLPGLIDNFLHLLLDVGILLLDLLRLVTGGFIVGQVVENFERNSLRRFVDDLLRNTFAGQRLTDVRAALRMDSPSWGLRCHVTHRTFVMESPAMPLAAMHANRTLDLFRMAGVLSFDSFRLFEPRYTVRWLDDNGRESLFPASRYHIARFLESGRPNLRVYALSGSELRDSIQFATEHFKAMGIRLSWNHFITVPQLTSLVTHRITTEEEFSLVCSVRREVLNADGSSGTIRQDTLGRYLIDHSLKDAAERELRITSLTPFHVLVQDRDVNDTVTSSRDFQGFTAGRNIEEGERSVGCTTPGRNDECCNLVQRLEERREIGSGVAMRNVYPGYFSKMVMAHELGHYFGLCHIHHDGVQNIMFSLGAGNRVLDWGMLRYYLRSEPHFSHDDERNAWRFIVDQLQNEL